MRIQGKCHCGNISFTLFWDPHPTEILARACTCSFCVKHGGLWASNPKGAVEITIEDLARVSRYEFATRTAQFQVCASCGVVPVVTCQIDGDAYAVVSVNAFEDSARALVKAAPVSHDGEDTDARLARRKRTWTPLRPSKLTGA